MSAQKPRVEVVAVNVFGSCFQEHWHESEQAPSGYGAIAVVKVDGVEYRLDYSVDYIAHGVSVKAAWDQGRVPMSDEERAELLGQVADMVEKAFESGLVNDLRDESDAPGIKYTTTVPAFIANR